jgi:pullulanase-type alpha-1,6-glucosidase
MKPTTQIRLVVALLTAALLAAGAVRVGMADDADQPASVAIAGTLQSENGCPGDWQPDCEATWLTFDEEDQVWQGTFTIAPGDDQDGNGLRYKAALNGGWGENYDVGAQANGADIPLIVSAATEVTFYYDHKTHWVTDDVTSVIAVAAGDFQSELGCAADNDPSCLRSWLQDPDGDGTYTFTTTDLPAGTYSLIIATGQTPAEARTEPQAFIVGRDNDEIYFAYNPATESVVVSTTGAPAGRLDQARAYWVAADTVLWKVENPADVTVTLHAAPDASLAITSEGIAGGVSLPLAFDPNGADDAVRTQFPHLRNLPAFRLSEQDAARAAELVRGQVAVSVVNAEGRIVDATGLQIPGVLDDLYAYDGPLGVTWDSDVPTLRVWAPTAQSVALLRYEDATTAVSATVEMTRDDASGVWSVIGAPGWRNTYYQFQVDVYVPATLRIERNAVTDPYSLALSPNSTRSLLVDLNDPALQPDGWGEGTKPDLAKPEDIVLYELHVRDFSVSDLTVPEALRGTFMAFTQFDSAGMQHLRRLAEAGLTHIHLLPAFDIASVNEDKSTWQSVDDEALRAMPGESEEQQAAIMAIAGSDGFNWGYDPYHFTVPEGSYATDPDGVARVREFRAMVRALNASGLRVVMDVVYNHTNASGQSERSVFDRIVPGYYHRLNSVGAVERSTCCENTASEHRMMEKFMIDSVLTWARDYKVDGFRFDLMGHHMLRNMTALRAALDTLTVEADGVDGRSVYVYGEGWNFGEVADGQRGENATQFNIGGSGIGVFNDRLRDGARGGGPFGPLTDQGFLTGLWFTPNAAEDRVERDQRAVLINYSDWIRVGLAGNLRDYELPDGRTGRVVLYNGAPAGYTRDPQENIVYVSAHDNETLWDAVQAKMPAEATIDARIRAHRLGLSLVMFSQGVPFFHAGDELLRSKSLDRNSYNSGDWFNRVDWTGQTNNWAVGLPPAGDNGDKWDLIRPLLAASDLAVSPAQIQESGAYFEELLRIRRSSELFRLPTAEAVSQHLTFLNAERDQIEGLIVMVLDNTGPDRIDDPYDQIVVLFNARQEAVTFTDERFVDGVLALHPVQAASVDALTQASAFDATAGAFTVPAQTVGVFVSGEGLQPAPTATVTVASPTEELEFISDTPTATPAPAAPPPATGDNNLPWIVAGLVALLGAGGALWWWRRRR